MPGPLEIMGFAAVGNGLQAAKQVLADDSQKSQAVDKALSNLEHVMSNGDFEGTRNDNIRQEYSAQRIN
jgi:hypothetical protein